MEKYTNLTPESSLHLIQEMIQKAKKSFRGISFYFLMWGWLLLAAGVAEYILAKIVHFQSPYIVWPIMGILGGIIAAIYGSRKKEEKIISYAGKIIGLLWGGFVITLILVIIASVANRLNPGPFIMLLTGLPTFVSGGIIKFKPLMFGGIVFWLIGICSFFFLQEYTSLLFSLAILLGYIVPGYLLQRIESNV